MFIKEANIKTFIMPPARNAFNAHTTNNKCLFNYMWDRSKLKIGTKQMIYDMS